MTEGLKNDESSAFRLEITQSHEEFVRGDNSNTRALVLENLEVGSGGLCFNPRLVHNLIQLRLENTALCNFSSGRSASLSDELVSLGELGYGACSTVYKKLHLPSLRIVAEKKISVSDAQKCRQIVRELQTLYLATISCQSARTVHIWVSDLGPFKCPFSVQKYIVDFYDAFIDLDNGQLSVLVEYMDGGSLQDVVDAGGCPHETVLANIAQRILNGLVYLHSIRNCIHRDIKPANLLINHHGDVKIGDFGTARECSASVVDRGCDAANIMTFVGTVTYMSPERLLGERYDYTADIWSLGMTLMTCALGRFPYLSAAGHGFWSLLQALREQVPPELPRDRYSSLARDFVKRCLQRSPESRPSARHLLEHPFVARCNNPTVCTTGIKGTGDKLKEVKLELQHIIDMIKAHYCGFFCRRKDRGLLQLPYLIDSNRLARLANQLGAPSMLVTLNFSRMLVIQRKPNKVG